MSDTELAPEVAPVPAESESAEEDVAPGSPVEDVQPAGKPPGPCCEATSSIMIIIYPTPWVASPNHNLAESSHVYPFQQMSQYRKQQQER